MAGISMETDCSNCAALCCVSLVFDQSDMFAFDKAAGEACPNLEACGRCTIHEELEEKGFKGCVLYDCQGAGPHVTQEIFGGQSWQENPTLLKPMMEAFRIMRQVHELNLLLTEAGKLELSPEERRQQSSLLSHLMPEDGWTNESLFSFEQSAVSADIYAFLRTLRSHYQNA